jgi:ADP-heptose:LPS heptosyltransferase
VKWSPLMSIPAIVGTTPTRNIPPAPYMRAEPERTARWAERLGPDGFKIGIVWQGNPSHARDRTRSLPLAAFAPLADTAGLRLISLQKGFGAEQIATVPFRDRIEALVDSADVTAGALLDHAALIAGLDLVITVDTMLAHLAGALGRPVWLLLEHLPDWRWLTERPDTPWYPSMRLFRQRIPGAWAPVVQEVVSALRDVVRP